MKTKAAILHSLGEPLQIWDLEIPALSPGQVLVEIAYSGICRTQLNEIKGYKGADPYLPHTLGHEGSGIVLEVGSQVTKVHPGDHVVLSWIKGEGIEAGGCKYGSKQGTVNSGAISTFIEKAVISENRLVPIPKDICLRQAALLGCAIPTGAGIVFNQLALQKDSTFAVFGAGGIGLSAILAARYLKAAKILVVDVSEEKLQQALALGATHTICSHTTDPVAAIQSLTQGKGATHVLECVGRADVMEKAFQATAAGGACVLAGNLPKGQKIQIDPFDLILGKKIQGSWGGSTQMDREIPLYVQMIREKQIPLAQLITHETSLEEINSLVQLLDEGKVGRGILKLQPLL